MGKRTGENITSNEKKNSIGEQNEGSLHSSIKKWYSKEGDKLEEKVGGYIIDIVRKDLLVEIQTRNFGAIRDKIKKLVTGHNVRLVYPVPREKWIVKVAGDGSQQISRRRSPKSGNPIDVFDEMIRMPQLIHNKNLEIEILMISQEEIWCNDGKGSWRRKGASIVDKKLLEVQESIVLRTKEDFLCFLPDSLGITFTNKELAKEMKITVAKATKITYCLKKMEAIEQVGKKRNEIVYSIVSE